MNSTNTLKKYNSNGFVVLKKVFSKNEIDKILLELEIIKKLLKKTKDKKFFHKTKDGKINTIHNVQEFYKKNKIEHLINKKKLLLTVKNILGDAFKIRNIEFFLKPKKTGMASPFHQDNFYWNIINAMAINVWIACSSSSKLNGGLCYLKQSNKLGTLNHEISNLKGSSQQISKNILDKLKFKRIFPSIEKGDCLLHHPNTIHGSLKNRSNLDRIGMTISFTSKNAKIDKYKETIYKKNLKKILNRF